MPGSNDHLADYRSKRDFSRSPEPFGDSSPKGDGNRYVIQKHDARRLHYDLRLELDGVLRSWAVTKGPSLDPSDKRLAVQVEDHPLDYGDFEGVIPDGYGAGTVMLWDEGTWEPQEDPHEGLERGMLKFLLHGERLQGGFALVRMKRKGKEKRVNWLLVKERDAHAAEEKDPREAWTDSVRSGRDLAAIAEEGPSLEAFKERGNADEHTAARKANKAAPPSKDASSRGSKHAEGRPDFVPPQLATLRDTAPKGDNWLHEIKFDGYRIQAVLHQGHVTLWTRNRKDWTHKYPSIVDALTKLKVGSAVLDGELAAVDEDGHSNFGLLQNDADAAVLRYFVFDLLYLDGQDWSGERLLERKARLQKLLNGLKGPVVYSDHVKGDGGAVIERACRMHLEGIISKKADSPYRSGRGSTWIKAKCVGRDEFLIAGYRQSDKRGRPFSSLILAEFEGDDLVYRGRVGTGFNAAIFEDLAAKMKRLERKSSPLATTPNEARSRAVWLTPRLVAEVAYAERTSDGLLRHPSFLGLREDKAAEEVRLPAPKVGAQSARPAAKPTERAVAADLGVRLTHPDRVLFPEQGASKRDLADYYAAHADSLLRFCGDRPLTLVRCPHGRDGQCFFQKHYTKGMPKAVRPVTIEEKGGKNARYLLVDNAEGLVSTAQIGALELHIWGARADRLDRPERLVFDLDPDEGLDFSDVRDAAFDLREVLRQEAGLESFPLLTGGKGIYVIAPIQRRSSWDDAKAFTGGLARSVSSAAPERFVATASKAKRKDKIFVDYLRNERGSTAIAPFSPRARPGAPVATPVAWDELPRIESAAAYTLDNIRRRLASLKSDPWAGYETLRQSLTKKVLARFS